MDSKDRQSRRIAIYQNALAYKKYEPVKGDFEIKLTCMDLFSHFVDLQCTGTALEVGSGSGFMAALLSTSCGRVVATDMLSCDPHTHSIGISVANGLLEALGVENVDVMSASAECLPFRDSVFDFVFSCSVVEHIDDKEKAVREMMRVVKPGGVVIFGIPTYIESLCAFIHLYLYIGKRIMAVAYAKVFGRRLFSNYGLLPQSDDLSRPGNTIFRTFWKNHPSFPLPQPHGAYKNILAEFVQQLPWNWIRLAKRTGAKSVDTFAFFFLPFNILEVFSTRLISKLYSATRFFHKRLGKSFLQYFAYGWCLVLRKPNL